MAREKGLVSFVLVFLTVIAFCEALTFLGPTSGNNVTYAKFPKWNACINASLKFEFKSRNSDGLLMYTDDNGRYDFFQVALVGGQVRLWMNVVDEKDGVVELIVGKNLNDGNWHHVEVKRNRMNTTLFVDNYQSSMMSFGSDFQFGDFNQNNYVYFGGLPPGYKKNLRNLALPSSWFESRFQGQLRNILYFNCTCIPVRAEMLDSRGVSRQPLEACERRHNCPRDCACISLDAGPGCECFETRECADQFTTRYYLPMDQINDRDLWNPSGLDSRVYGRPALVPGAIRKAIQLDGRTQYIRVTGPGHKRECFGNLTECFTGYYLGMWLKFDGVGDRRGVYLSNGGHMRDNHGIAMYYSKGKLEYVFKTHDGREWRVKDDNLLEGRWYHVAATWSDSIGLMLYVNGEQIDHDMKATQRNPANPNNRYNDFVVGQANDRTGTDRLGVMTVDEFIFMSSYRPVKELRETGPFYEYYLDFDALQGDRFITTKTEAMTSAGVGLVPGRVGNAVNLRGGNDYVNLGDVQGLCMGDLAMCRYGYYVSMWVSFTRLDSSTRYLLSSPKGVNIYYTDDRLHATASMVDRFWETYYQGITPGVWYFLEVSWSKDMGLMMYLNGVQVAHQSTDTHKSPRTSSDKNFYLGRANNPESWQRGANAAIDNFEAYYADRDSLFNVHFIERDRPTVYKFPFEAMTGNRINHPSIVVRTYGNPDLIPAKLGNGLDLDGRSQYVDFGDHSTNCFGNLDNCAYGATMAMWMKPEKFQRDAYYFSTGDNGFNAWYKNKRLYVSASTSTRTWEVSTDAIEPMQWQHVEVTWSDQKGLRLFSDNELVASSNQPRTRSTSGNPGGRVYLGRGNMDMSKAKYGAAMFDEMEYWYADRDFLSAFGYVQRGKPMGYIIDMDEILGNRLLHATLPIRVVGSARTIPGRIRNAVEIKGSSQYLDIGDHSDQCMGNLKKCLQGITLSMWIRFRRFENNMVFLSTGGHGLALLYRNSYLFARAKGGSEVSIPYPQTNHWYFLEVSWSPDHGLEMYLDNKLVATDPDGKLEDLNLRHPGSFFVGRGNHGDTPSGGGMGGDFDIDELEIMYGRRDYLKAMGYLTRPVDIDVDNTPDTTTKPDFNGYEAFFMDEANGNIVVHPKYVVTLVNGARLQRGKIGNAASLSGRGQYVDLGAHNTRCMANLELCRHGLTLDFWMRPRTLREGDVYLSSPAYSVYYQNRQLTSKFNTPEKSWTVSTPKLRENRWQRVTLSWHPRKGLRMFLDDNEVDTAKGAEQLQGDAPDGTNIFVGKALEEDNPRAPSPDVLVDELQIWNDDIDQLRGNGDFGVVVREINLDPSRYRGGYLYLDDRTIRGYGGIQVTDGRGSQVLRLNGQQQYLDLGEKFFCDGDLESCRNGATIRFVVKPDRLTDGQYFIDSFPVVVYYRDGRLYAEMQTADRKWEVSAPDFQARRWQQVDLSWHPSYGLSMYINGRRVASQNVPTFRTPVSTDEYRSYFGGPLVPGRDRQYISAMLEGLQVYDSRREAVPTYIVPVRPTRPTRPPTTPRPTRPITIYPPRTPRPRPPRPDVRPSGPSSIMIRFIGRGYVTYNMATLPDNFLRQVDEEEVTFWFLTDQRDGLIWLQEENGRTMHFSMKDGDLRFVNQQDPYAPQEVNIIPRNGQKFTDWDWHHVNMTRKGNDVTITVDGEHDARYTMPVSSRNLQFLTKADVYLGGHPEVRDATNGLVDRSLNGGIADVVYHTKSPGELIFVNLVSEGQPSGVHGPVTFENRTGITGAPPRTRPTRPTVTFTRPPPRTPRPTTPRPIGPGPITFRSSKVHVTLPRLTLNSGSMLSYRFQTIEEQGLMLYTHGSNQRPGAFIAVELYDGKLYFVYNLGGLTKRVQFSDRLVSDGQQHRVEARFYNGYLILMLDGEQKRVELNSSERFPIEFQRALYLGGYTSYSNDANDNNRLPWHIWSRDGYQGCFEDFQIDRQRVDLHQYVVDQFLFGNVDRQCLAMPRVCALNQLPCVHGVCRDTWDGYVCDCSDTAFVGKNCDRAALVGSLNGEQWGHVPVLLLGSHTNDLSLRFKTPLGNALLFQTHTGESDEYLRAVLEDGVVKVTTNLGGTSKTYYAGEGLNDLDWHNLYIRRRGNQIELWVDDFPSQLGNLDGENFYFDIERIYLGSLAGSDMSVQGMRNYIGYLQNFLINNVDILNQLQRQGGSTVNFTVSTLPRLPHLIYNPVTVTSRNTFVQMDTLEVPPKSVLSFMFKTQESSGVMLFNGGVNREFIALELYNGFLHFSFNTSDSAPALRISTPQSLNDNKWHHVIMRRNEDGQSFTVSVDGYTSTLESEAPDGQLDLQGPLYIGGLPENLFKQDYVERALLSKNGFQGCLASIDMRGTVPDLLKYSRGNANIIGGCTDIKEVCLPETCKNFGKCIPSGISYYCDCNMTSFVGTTCVEEANGFRFVEGGGDAGILIYTFPTQERPTTMADDIALGFMTYEQDGVLMRIKSKYLGDFIELRLENGHVVAEYLTDINGNSTKITQAGKMFNDGNYHMVRFYRNNDNATLYVDTMPGKIMMHKNAHGLFENQGTVYVGGVEEKGVIERYFNGIVAGLYINGLHVTDKAVVKENTRWRGDVAIAPHQFGLAPTVTSRPIGWETPPPTLPGGGVTPAPPFTGGAGLPVEGIGGGGVGGAGPGIGVLPSGAGGSGVMTGALGQPPVSAAVAGPAAIAGGVGPRAGIVVGTVLGILAAMSSLMWAFYRCKPGWCAPCGGGGGAGAGGGPVSISSPSNLGVVQALGGAKAGAGAGAGAGAMEAGGGSAGYGFYSASHSASAGGAGAGGGSAYDSATLRATKTFTSSGTTIGTPKPARAALGSTASATSGYSYSRNIVDGNMGVHGGASVSSYNYEGGPDYDLAPGISGSAANYQSNTLNLASAGYSASTMSSNYNYQVQNVRTVTGHQQMLGYAGSSMHNVAAAPGAMGEEVRVDCCLITADGRSVVTGSSLGPPQVWDMHSGELLRIMKGDTVGSTNLHLACNDSLLVGAVNADLEINNYSTSKGVTNRMLQIWDSSTGRPLEMAEHEYCSALCVMNDGDKVLFARTDKYGSGTEVVLWDLMGNQPIKNMRYDCPIGNNDFVNYVNLSQNNRYVLVGFTNTFDNHAEYVVFDMTITSYNIMEPSFRRFDANTDCTAVLPRDEAVTGLRNGDLVIWSLRTGEASRQLVSGKSSHAHSREVKAVAVSNDNKYLVSASSDGTLKVWDMDTERQIHTLAGHSDEVWCVAISPDSEIVVSGSRDGTIRLWRLKNGSEICAFSAGVDVFHVTMSHDKSTIVALGDKYGARKLIMLQVVRSKIRRQVSA